jgi:hypothetical protein
VWGVASLAEGGGTVEDMSQRGKMFNTEPHNWSLFYEIRQLSRRYSMTTEIELILNWKKVFDKLNGEFHNIMNDMSERAFDDSTKERVNEFWEEGDELFYRILQFLVDQEHGLNTVEGCCRWSTKP